MTDDYYVKEMKKLYNKTQHHNLVYLFTYENVAKDFIEYLLKNKYINSVVLSKTSSFYITDYDKIESDNYNINENGITFDLKPKSDKIEDQIYIYKVEFNLRFYKQYDIGSFQTLVINECFKKYKNKDMLPVCVSHKIDNKFYGLTKSELKKNKIKNKQKNKKDIKNVYNKSATIKFKKGLFEFINEYNNINGDYPVL